MSFEDYRNFRIKALKYDFNYLRCDRSSNRSERKHCACKENRPIMFMVCIPKANLFKRNVDYRGSKAKKLDYIS